MADDNLVLEHLRSIRTTLADHGERLDRIEVRLSSMEQTLGSLYATAGGDRDAMRSMARRIDRIEKRLELADK